MESSTDVAMNADGQVAIKVEESSLEVPVKNGAEAKTSPVEDMKTEEVHEENGIEVKSEHVDENSDVIMTTDGSDPVAPSVEGQPTGRTGFTSEIFKIELNGIPKFFGANQVHIYNFFWTGPHQNVG